MNTLYSFQRFSDFPLEIRNLIWGFAVEDIEPRLVYLPEHRLSVDSMVHRRANSDNKRSSSDVPSVHQTSLFVAVPVRGFLPTLVSKIIDGKITFGELLVLNKTNHGQKPYLASIMASGDEGRKIFLPRKAWAEQEDISSMQEDNIDRNKNDLQRCSIILRRDAHCTEIEFPQFLAPKALKLRDNERMIAIPSLLQACSESKEIASKSYRLAVPTPGCLANVDFNFEKDFIYLGLPKELWFRADTIGTQLANPDFQLVQNLAVVVADDLKGDGDVENGIAILLAHFGKVKKLHILAKPATSLGKSASPALRYPTPGPMFETHAELMDEIISRGVTFDKCYSVDIEELRDLHVYFHNPPEEGEQEVLPWEMPEIQYRVISSNGAFGE